MRIPLTSWLLLIGVASAVTESTQVFIRDPESSTHQPIFDGIVRPDTAKLIFSRRLGFSHLYSLSGCDAHSIQQIDDLGGPQPQPFSLGKNHDKSRILLVVEGVAKADDLLPSSVGHLGRFEVKPAPHRKGTGQLVDEFLTEAERHTIENASEYFRSKALEKLSIHLENKIETRNGRSIVHITSMTTADKQYGAKSPEYQGQVALIKEAIQDLYSLDNSVVTLVFTPLEKFTKDASSSSWGPKIQRRGESEAPLTTSSDKPIVQSSPLKNSVPSPLVDSKAIPSRFTSLDDCQRTTKNCTGHGECKRLLSEQVGDRLIEYFSCVCGSSVSESPEGAKKTTYYGGAACQKVDLSAPFWLLAGVSIFLVTVIGLGIGLLSSIGSEDLPSVIGAGVTGPRAK